MSDSGTKGSESRWLEVIGAIAVVLSLLFVAYEVRQANKIALVDGVSTHYASFSAINAALLTDPELASLLARAATVTELDEFSAAEQIQLGSFIRMLCNTWIPANVAYDNGQLAQESFDAVFDDARSAIHNAGPAMREMWRDVVFTYPGVADVAIIAFLRDELGPPEDADPLGGSGAWSSRGTRPMWGTA